MLGASLKELGSTNIGIAGVNTRNVQLYQSAIKGLSAEQAVFALSTKGATNAQIKHIMLMETSTLAKGTYTRADIQAALAKYGLVAATSTLTAEQQKELVNSGLLSSAKMAEMASVLGLSTTENRDVFADTQEALANDKTMRGYAGRFYEPTDRCSTESLSPLRKLNTAVEWWFKDYNHTRLLSNFDNSLADKFVENKNIFLLYIGYNSLFLLSKKLEKVF